MFHRHPDYKSRFRILKGGKISLVVSALLVSSSLMVNDANAATVEIGGASGHYDFTTGNVNSLLISEFGDIDVNDGTVTALTIDTTALALDQTITNDGTISLSGGSNASTIFVNSLVFGNIINNGTIDNTVATVSAAAAMNFAQDVSGDITNNGIVLVNSGGAGWGINFEDDVTGEVINTVNGSITVNSANEAYGIRLSEEVTGGLIGNILNSGSIDATSTINSAYGIHVEQMTDGTITNDATGTITVVSDQASGYGINVDEFQADDAGIYNDGAITVTSTHSGYGIKVGGWNALDGFEAINTGSIVMNSAGSDDLIGISIQANLYEGTRASTIENSGTITINNTYTGSSALYGYGIRISGDMYDNTTVTNSGTITVDSRDAELGNSYGIFTSNRLYDDASITNALGGSISISAGEDGFGIKAEGTLYDNASILNAGTISVEAGMAGDPGDSQGFGIYAYRFYNNSQIENSGTISITSAGDGTGIHVESGMIETSRIVNSGTITINTDYNGVGIYAHYLFGTNTLTNSGTITVNAGLHGQDGYASGIEIYSMYDSANASTISNTGTITVDGSDGSVALRIGGSDSIDVVTNSGTLTATVNGVADYEGYALSLLGAATFTNTSTGEMYGNVYTDLPVVVNNAGLISLPHNATAYMGQLTNTGTLEIGLLTDGTMGNTTYSKIVTDTATFNAGSILAVNVLGASTNVALLVGETLEDVVTAQTTLTINALSVEDNSALLNFEYVEDGLTIDLNIVEGTTLLDSTIAGGGSGNAQEAAGALQTLQDAGTPALNSFFSALGGLGSDAAVAQAVQSTTPVTTVSNVGATTQIMNGIQGIVEQRQGVGGGLNSGEAVFAEKSFWFKPYGSWGSQDNKDGINGFDLKARGAGLGFDGEYAQDSKLGFALFYTDARVEVDGMPQKSDLDVYTALVYGSVPVLDEKTKLLYQAGYSWQKTDSSRYITVMNETAKADYTSKTASLDLKLLRDYKINSELTLQPLVEATYRNFKSPSYSESGATTNLSTDSFEAEELIVGIGTLAHYKIDDVSKVVANVNVGYDLLNDENAITSAYSVAPTVKFTTNGIDNGRWSYEAGVGYERQLSKESTINLMYNYEAQGSAFDSHSISARVQYKF